MKKIFEKVSMKDSAISIANTMRSEIMGVMSTLDLNINDFNNVLSRYTLSEQHFLLTTMLNMSLDEIRSVTPEQFHEISFWADRIMSFYTSVKSGFKNIIKEYGDKIANQILLKEIPYNTRDTYDEVDITYIANSYLPEFNDDEEDITMNIFIWIILKYIAIARIIVISRNDAMDKYQ